MRHWKDNPHWMLRGNELTESKPSHEPEKCELCGWLDEGGVENSDLIWDSRYHVWLCMECD